MPGFWSNMGGLALERINAIWDSGSYDSSSDTWAGGFAPWHAFVSATSPASEAANWSGFAVISSMYFNQRRLSNGTQGALVGYDVTLSAGTWDLALTHRADVNNGIYTVSIDGTDVGTIDGYASSGGVARDTLTGITVASDGPQRLKLTMATQNASSGGFIGQISAIEMQRTA